jgi:hypothetical protein
MQASEIARLLTRVLVFDNNIMMNISYIEGVHANFFWLGTLFPDWTRCSGAEEAP